MIYSSLELVLCRVYGQHGLSRDNVPQIELTHSSPCCYVLLTDRLAGTACFLGLLRRWGLVGKDWHKEYSEGPNRIMGLNILEGLIDSGTGRG